MGEATREAEERREKNRQGIYTLGELREEIQRKRVGVGDHVQVEGLVDRVQPSIGVVTVGPLGVKCLLLQDSLHDVVVLKGDYLHVAGRFLGRTPNQAPLDPHLHMDECEILSHEER